MMDALRLGRPAIKVQRLPQAYQLTKLQLRRRLLSLPEASFDSVLWRRLTGLHRAEVWQFPLYFHDQQFM
jgi:hypothetical protein